MESRASCQHAFKTLAVVNELLRMEESGMLHLLMLLLECRRQAAGRFAYQALPSVLICLVVQCLSRVELHFFASCFAWLIVFRIHIQ